MKISQQKKGTHWIDEAGNRVAYSSIKKSEKVFEAVTAKIAQKAIKASLTLQALKAFIDANIQIAIAAFHKDYKGKRKEFKGNYTITNFNQTLKVEISVNKPVKFDDLLIQEAKSQLMEFLKDGVSAKHEAIKDMVIDAFETTRGKMDVKKILSLQRYQSRINDKRYTRAMELIAQAQRRPDTAVYYRVSVKDEQNKWKVIPLSLSDVP